MQKNNYNQFLISLFYPLLIINVFYQAGTDILHSNMKSAKTVAIQHKCGVRIQLNKLIPIPEQAYVKIDESYLFLRSCFNLSPHIVNQSTTAAKPRIIALNLSTTAAKPRIIMADKT